MPCWKTLNILLEKQTYNLCVCFMYLYDTDLKYIDTNKYW